MLLTLSQFGLHLAFACLREAPPCGAKAGLQKGGIPLFGKWFDLLTILSLSKERGQGRFLQQYGDSLVFRSRQRGFYGEGRKFDTR